MWVHTSRRNPFVERTARSRMLSSVSPLAMVCASIFVFGSSDSSIALAGREVSRSPDVNIVSKPRNSFRCFRLIWVLVLLSMVLSGMQARTQEVTAGITGTVTDPNGAAVGGAIVTATDTQRGTSFSTRSDADGIYYLQRIPVGTYQLRAESAPFSTATLPPFTLVLNQIARLDFHMVFGPLKEVVQVSGEAPLLQTQTTEVSTIIDAETNVALPLASRNYVQLALLAPGAVTPNREAIATANRIDMAGQPYINGNREQANNFLLDGMDNNQVSDNLVAYSPSPDAIQEFNLITQNASAEFGNFQGGIISVSIKSGTNQFHGDLSLRKNSQSIRSTIPQSLPSPAPASSTTIPSRRAAHSMSIRATSRSITISRRKITFRGGIPARNRSTIRSIRFCLCPLTWARRSCPTVFWIGRTASTPRW